MKDSFARLVTFLKSELSSAQRFFTGVIYPWVAVALALLSHLFGLEYLFGSLSVALLCIALVFCDSGKPILTFSLSIVFHVSLEHSPGVPNFSSYLFSGYRLALFAVLAIAVGCALVYHLIKYGVLKGLSIRIPGLIPLLLLSLAFLTNGAFSDGWSGRDLVHGLCQAAVYLGLYLLYYLTLERDGEHRLCEYLVFSSSAVAWLLILQVFARLGGEGVIVDGAVNKDAMLFGWGVWNTAGVSLTVIIPLCFLGVMKSRHPVYYFVTAAVAYLASVLTMSRGALLFGGIAFATLCIVSCFFGEHKKLCRWVTAAGVCLCICGGAVLWGKISSLLRDFLDRGFDDNGRFELWRIGWENFLSAPVFGVGFFSFVSESFVVAEFFPKLAHQTFIQLLSSMGLFGALSYLYYRFVTVRSVLIRPSLVKWLLFASVLVLLAQSAIDTYMFRFHAIPLYSATLVIIELISADGKPTQSEKNNKLQK